MGHTESQPGTGAYLKPVSPERPGSNLLPSAPPPGSSHHKGASGDGPWMLAGTWACSSQVLHAVGQGWKVSHLQKSAGAAPAPFPFLSSRELPSLCHGGRLSFLNAHGSEPGVPKQPSLLVSCSTSPIPTSALWGPGTSLAFLRSGSFALSPQQMHQWLMVEFLE